MNSLRYLFRCCLQVYGYFSVHSAFGTSAREVMFSPESLHQSVVSRITQKNSLISMNLGWIMALGADTIILSSGTEYNTWIL